MLKKKNIAMMMAVATAATTAAPAFAAVTSQEDVIRTEGMKAFVDEVEAKFNMKYADVAENGDKRDKHVYKIQFDAKTIVDKVETGQEATQATLDQFKAAVNGMKNGQVIDVTITDGGHEERNGKVYVNAIPEYVAEGGKIAELEQGKVTLAGYTVVTNKKVVSDKEVAYTLEFKNDNTKDVEYTATLGNGDKELDFTKPVRDVAGKLKGFENKAYEAITPEKPVEKRLSKSVEKTMQVSELFDGADLTEAGQALAGVTFEANDYSTSNNDDRLAKENMDETKVIKEVKADKEYEVKLFVKNINLNRASVSDSLTKEGDLAEITITSSSKAVMAAFIEKLKTYTPGENAKLIAGADRFETAIEISKHNNKTDGTVNNVVLVGQDAIVDGLAAGPLAAAKKAPILYSAKDAVNESTMKEITRLFGTVAGKTVYIVGGESQISKEVEKQLSSKGINVKRIAGEDRVDTSLKIAKEIGAADHATNAFVVGYKGEADAMSIASVASKVEVDKVTPIIVSGVNGLTEDAKDYLVKNNKSDVKLVGGTTTLTSNVEEELKALKVAHVERIAGEDRQDTNAKVLKEFYKNYDGDVYVSKAYALVDALAAAPSIKGAPMVLAGESLSKSQENVLEDINQGKNVYQVGNGIAKTIMNKVINLVK
ncbi:cell wall-binding repeat-containing protein [Romboutsia sp. 1001216sp1]|uniref:cell wall-binding repeat-containing protein n=1 Tax=Romboutsia sp. 1001216sp1 TaxID=2986997 RepID=UPI00232B7B92|nr:cell wall-binding repeat-containing protein [Romboutsia sp. 1001216sp1]MDB8804736.1 cell wall-binding repeat-containing protein [Romboutsia sp. 1001216sp1]MDB8806340.1 cell wall-binding repeat-containing protein [Romboutsia sp. 1001216sp1]MDB8810382.1 cell wall-binding repeat-containing protein [Romboutsia sp. 1001216sp1]MDB8817540.1 cell wall-binding repeat-containing protein [Romboutsia sp. 1001216sp1]MDB8818579.1 cell wall-binding repeat-containing protein [Romboutsia sp. 1001216sp1]